MVDIGLDTRVSPSYDPKRYLIGLDGPSTISGPSRPTTTKTSGPPTNSDLISGNGTDVDHDVVSHATTDVESAGQSQPADVPTEPSTLTEDPACSFHDPAHPFNIGFAESQHSSATSLGSQLYLDPVYQEHISNLERLVF